MQFAVCYNKQKEVRKLNSKQRAKLENIISAIEDIVSDEQENLTIWKKILVALNGMKKLKKEFQLWKRQ